VLSIHEQQSEAAPEALASANDTSNSPGCVAEVETFGDMYIKGDNQYLVYQGERIVSLRELMRRYQYHNSYWPAGEGTTAASRKISYDIHDFPFYRGWETNGQDTATNSVPATADYNFCGTTLLNFLTPAFACRRGGLRHKAQFVSLGSANRSQSMAVARHNLFGATNDATEHLQNGVNGDKRSEILETTATGLGGTHVTACATNPVLEYETPFYTNGQRFLPGRKVNLYDQAEMAHELTIDVPGGTGGNDYRIDKYVSIAEDFQLGLFVGAPILYAYSNPVAVT
jgi:hypothetical protein